MRNWTRRSLLTAALGTTAGLAVGCTKEPAMTSTPILPTDPAVATAENLRRVSGGNLVEATLNARPATVDLGGTTVQTWAYDGRVPGREIRAKVGDTVRVHLANDLPAETTIHWHGLALRNDMDGVPALTQDPVAAGGKYTYEFTVPDAGTHWFHPHVGVQLDRGLYGPIIVEDPADPGAYDVEAVLVLDDWLDGVDGRDPDAELAMLRKGMDMSGDHMMMSSSAILGGDAGDVEYPLFLINGRTPTDPFVVKAKPGQRVLLRLINSGGDTAFRFAVGGHRFGVIATDGYAVTPVEAGSLLIGMGERYDVVFTAKDGAFPIVAAAEGKGDRAAAILRTGGGDVDVHAGMPELLGKPVMVGDLATPADRLLVARPVDLTHEVVLGGDMMTYNWTVNGKTHPDVPPFEVREGQRVRLAVRNDTEMFHPVHLHGHTFQVGGVRKDTVLALPGEELQLDVDAVNPGQWMLHCHNAYHGEAGMMSTFSYVRLGVPEGP